MRSDRLKWYEKRKNCSEDEGADVISPSANRMTLIGSDLRVVVRRISNRRYSDEWVQSTVKYSPHVMVWGRDCELDSLCRNYKKCLLLTVKGSDKNTWKVGFQDDSASCHWSKMVNIAWTFSYMDILLHFLQTNYEEYLTISRIKSLP